LFAYAYHRAVYYSDSTFGAQSVIAFSEFLQCPVGIEYYGDPVMSTRMTISGNEFHDGTTGILVSRNGAALSITRNSFVSLSSYGVQNTSGSAIVAQNNWWGNASGPSGSGTGSGVPVSANVDYQNWWTSASADQNGVWNVIAQRRGESQVVDIYYDLVGQAGTTYTVTVKVSATGGEPYSITPVSGSLSGKIGSGIQPGTALHAVWDGAYGGGGNYTGTMRIQVTANLE
jgi:hypothetical protein